MGYLKQLELAARKEKDLVGQEIILVENGKNIGLWNITKTDKDKTTVTQGKKTKEITTWRIQYQTGNTVDRYGDVKYGALLYIDDPANPKTLKELSIKNIITNRLNLNSDASEKAIVNRIKASPGYFIANAGRGGEDYIALLMPESTKVKGKVGYYAMVFRPYIDDEIGWPFITKQTVKVTVADLEKVIKANAKPLNAADWEMQPAARNAPPLPFFTKKK